MRVLAIASAQVRVPSAVKRDGALERDSTQQQSSNGELRRERLTHVYPNLKRGKFQVSDMYAMTFTLLRRIIPYLRIVIHPRAWTIVAL